MKYVRKRGNSLRGVPEIKQERDDERDPAYNVDHSKRSDPATLLVATPIIESQGCDICLFGV
jgi:hypothetical protein